MFLTEVLSTVAARSPDQAWKRRRVMKLAAVIYEVLNQLFEIIVRCQASHRLFPSVIIYY